MGAAKFRVIGHDDVSGLQLAFPYLRLGRDTSRHASEMDWEMRRCNASVTQQGYCIAKYLPFATSPPVESNRAHE